MSEESLKRVIDKLVKILKARVIILFGSRARGDWGPWSDYDLLIIADFREKYLDRIARVLEVLNDVPLPIEPHPYTLEEALNMLRRGCPTIVDALEEGKVLYAEERCLRKLIEVLSELKKRGLRRSETSIVLPSDVE